MIQRLKNIHERIKKEDQDEKLAESKEFLKELNESEDFDNITTPSPHSQDYPLSPTPSDN